jgi:hypothetical protein
MGIKTDEEIVFRVLGQIQRWLNRFLQFQFSDLMFNVQILHATHFNQKELFAMYLEAGQYGYPVKNRAAAMMGLEPIEVMNMAYLENDLLKLHEEFIPLQSSHTMVSGGEAGLGGGLAGNKNGRPEKSPDKKADETTRADDKPNA